MVDLLLIDARLVAVAAELFAVADRLLQLRQALLLGELYASGLFAQLLLDMSDLLVVSSWVTCHSCGSGAGRPVQ